MLPFTNDSPVYVVISAIMNTMLEIVNVVKCKLRIIQMVGLALRLLTIL